MGFNITGCFSVFFWKPHCIKLISLLKTKISCTNNQANLDMKT